MIAPWIKYRPEERWVCLYHPHKKDKRSRNEDQYARPEPHSLMKVPLPLELGTIKEDTRLGLAFCHRILFPHLAAQQLVHNVARAKCGERRANAFHAFNWIA